MEKLCFELMSKEDLETRKQELIKDRDKFEEKMMNAKDKSEDDKTNDLWRTVISIDNEISEIENFL